MAQKSELLAYQGLTDDFFADLQERYGATLQGIHVDEKLMMLATIFYAHKIGGTIADSLSILDDGEDTPSEVVDIMNGVEEFDSMQQLDFTLALLNQVIETCRQQKSFKAQLMKAGLKGSMADQVAAILASGGDRTQAECELVSEAWQIVVNVNRNLATQIDSIMGVPA